MIWSFEPDRFFLSKNHGLPWFFQTQLSKFWNFVNFGMGHLSSIAVILGLGLFGNTREVDQTGMGTGIDDYNIQRECTDPTNGAKYQIGEVWSANEGCSQYECTQFDIRKLKKQQGAYINRTGIFAIAKLKG